MPYGSETNTAEAGQAVWDVSVGMLDPGQPGNPFRIAVQVKIASSIEYGPSPEARQEADDFVQVITDLLATRYPAGGVTGRKSYDALREITPTPVP